MANASLLRPARTQLRKGATFHCLTPITGLG